MELTPVVICLTALGDSQVRYVCVRVCEGGTGGVAGVRAGHGRT